MGVQRQEWFLLGYGIQTFLFPHYTLYRNLYLCSSHITFIIRKRKPTSKHTEDALLMWTVVRRSLILSDGALKGSPVPDWRAAAILFPPYPSTASPCGSGFLSESIRGSPTDLQADGKEDPHFWLLILGLSQHFHF